MSFDPQAMLSEEDYFEYGDPRISEYPLMGSPKPTFAIVAAYLAFVLLIGPNFMKNRKAFQLKLPMLLYNTAIVLTNGWITWKLLKHGWMNKYNWGCEPVDLSDHEDATEIVFTCWVFYISKFIEFSDTLFFTLRKKENQITKLHVFHHCDAPIFVWYSVKYGPGGYGTLFCLLNALVHVFMYSYYGLSGLGPIVQKYLWWKKYLTSLQLVQFTIMICYTFRWYFFPTKECKASSFVVLLQMFEAVLFFILFMKFYHSTYRKKQSED